MEQELLHVSFFLRFPARRLQVLSHLALQAKAAWVLLGNLQVWL
jgi:hypothetical protein